METTKTLLNKYNAGREIGSEELRHLQLVLAAITEDVFSVCKTNNLHCKLFAGTFLGAVRHKGFIPWDDDIDLCMPIEELLVLPKLINDTYKGKYICTGLGVNEPEDPFVGLKVSLAGTVNEEVGMSGFGFARGIGIDIFPIAKISETKIGRHFDHQRINFLIHTRVLSYEFSHKPVELLRERSSIGRYYRFRHFLGFFAHIICKDSSKIIKFYRKKRKHSSFYAISSIIGYGAGISEEKINETNLYYFEGSKYPSFKDFDFILSLNYGPTYMKLPPIEKRETHKRQKLDFGKY